MKTLISAISQASANRLKQPILGSFVLAWIAINHTFVIEFLFSKSEQKIELVKNSELSFYSDILFPVLLALVYTFGVPLIQHLIDKYKFRSVDLRRLTEKHKTERVKYTSQKLLSKKKAEASPEYWQSKLTRDLDNWDEERDNLKTQLKDKDDEIAKLKSESSIKVNDLNSKIRDKQKEIEDKQKEIEDLKIKYGNAQRKFSEDLDDDKEESYPSINIIEKSRILKKLLSNNFFKRNLQKEIADTFWLDQEDHVDRVGIKSKISLIETLLDKPILIPSKTSIENQLGIESEVETHMSDLVKAKWVQKEGDGFLLSTKGFRRLIDIERKTLDT